MPYNNSNLPKDLTDKIIKINSYSLPEGYEGHPYFHVDGGPGALDTSGMLHCISLYSNRYRIFSRKEILSIIEPEQLSKEEVEIYFQRLKEKGTLKPDLEKRLLDCKKRVSERATNDSRLAPTREQVNIDLDKNDSTEKRMAGDYEIMNSLHVGQREVVFGIDRTKMIPAYLCGYCKKNDLFVSYVDVVISDDYVETMKLYATRCLEEISLVQKELESMPGDMRNPITIDQLEALSYTENIEGRVVAINPTSLRPEYQSAASQLVLVNGGFGASGNSRGRAVYVTNLYDGSEARWNRSDIMCVVPTERLPDWAKHKLAELKQHTKKKEKVPER